MRVKNNVAKRGITITFLPFSAYTISIGLSVVSFQPYRTETERDNEMVSGSLSVSLLYLQG